MMAGAGQPLVAEVAGLAQGLRGQIGLREELIGHERRGWKEGTAVRPKFSAPTKSWRFARQKAILGVRLSGRSATAFGRRGPPSQLPATNLTATCAKINRRP